MATAGKVRVPVKGAAKTPKKQARRTPEERDRLAEAVLDGMHKGLSCVKSCKAVGVPNSTFMFWLTQDASLVEKYTRANSAMLELLADETMDIADETPQLAPNGGYDSAAVAHQRLRVDTRKWLLSKLAPKKYGDKVEQTVVGADGGPVAHSVSVVFK